MSMHIDEDQMEIIQEFVTESRDMIEQLEPAIIELGQDSDPETMNAIFRLFHSMKGSAGFLEFEHLARAAHASENLLDLIRNGEIELVPEHVSLLCKACDFAKEALDMIESDFSDDSMVAAADDISEKLQYSIDSARGGGDSATDPAEGTTDERGSASSVSATTSPKEVATPNEETADLPQLEINDEMRQSFVQEGNELLQNAEQGLLTWGENPEDKDSIGDIFRQIHSFKGNCGFFGFAQLEKLSHQMENILDRVKEGAQLMVENPADRLLRALDELQKGVNNIGEGKDESVDKLDDHLNTLQQIISPPLGDYLVKEGISEDAVQRAVSTQKKRVGEIMVDQGSATPEQVDKAYSQQQESIAKAKAESKPAARQKTPAKRQDIRVE